MDYYERVKRLHDRVYELESQVIDPTDTESGDFLQSDGTQFIPKSVSEMKTLLGLPSKVYKAFVNCSSTSNPTITVIKNTFTGTLTWTREDVGQYTLASDSTEFTSNKTIASVLPKTASFTVDNSVTAAIATNSISFVAFQDGAAADSKDFWVSVEVY